MKWHFVAMAALLLIVAVINASADNMFGAGMAIGGVIAIGVLYWQSVRRLQQMQAEHAELLARLASDWDMRPDG